MYTAVQRWVAHYFPPLLLAYWALAAGSVIVTLLPVPVPQAFKDAVYLSACRGKLWHDKPSALGPLRDWSVPQVWFLHFYVLGACCNAAVLLAYCLSLAQASSIAADMVQPLLALLLFQLHLVRRALETRFLLRYPQGAVMHGIAYLFGMSYYFVVPLSLLPKSWYQQQQWQVLAPWQALHSLLQHQLAALPSTLTALQVVGAAVFLAGNALQFASHWGLAALSKGGTPSSGKAAYKIPKGVLFKYVSCPHYLAEIFIYSGLALVTQGELLTLLMLVWVGVNLVLAAGATDKWYRRQFKTYPVSRKALVPFIF